MRPTRAWLLLVLMIAWGMAAPQVARATEQREVKVFTGHPDATAYFRTPVPIAVITTYQGASIAFFAGFPGTNSYGVESELSPRNQCPLIVTNVKRLSSPIPPGDAGEGRITTFLYVRPRDPTATESCSGEWQPGKTVVKVVVKGGSGIPPNDVIFEGQTLTIIEAH